ncbi:HAD family hydrolase [Chloroflexi bacterium TSY]|nr:HAD family hydrolase [Chloroflexi bacterium TSY]
MQIDVIAFDADDTLWENESYFSVTQDKFRQLLSPYHNPEWIDQKLFDTEMRNLQHFGYGVKGFTLSMIETAIDLTEGRIQGSEIQEILGWGLEMLSTPVTLLENVAHVVTTMAATYKLMLVTKGDLFHQESKIVESGLADHFSVIEIVSAKTADVYTDLFQKYTLIPGQVLMVGNSLRSDVLPVVEAGGHAVHIPHVTTWAHEEVQLSDQTDKPYHELSSIAQLPALVQKLNQTQ